MHFGAGAFEGRVKLGESAFFKGGAHVLNERPLCVFIRFRIRAHGDARGLLRLRRGTGSEDEQNAQQNDMREGSAKPRFF